jgi:hypothetical protein
LFGKKNKRKEKKRKNKWAKVNLEESEVGR